MSEQKPSLAIRFLPSLSDAAFLLPLLLLFGRLPGTKMLLGCGDTGWHLRTGEWILANGRIPRSDLFSFTKPGEPWYAWEWLWDVAFGWLHLHWGMPAVLVVNIAVICTVSALLFWIVRRKCDNVFVAAAVTSIAICASSIHWLARPHLFTMLFVLLFYAILDATREHATTAFWSLPLLTVLWTNLHGGFLAGILTILAFAGGELAVVVLDGDESTRKAALARSRTYLLTASACAVASLANPYGYRLHIHMWGYLTDPFLYDHINEYMATTFRAGPGLFYEAMFLLGAIALYRATVQRDFVHVFLIAGWAHLALVSQRNIPLFALLTAPTAAVILRDGLEALRTCPAAAWVRRVATHVSRSAAEFDAMDRLWRLHAVSVIPLGVIAALVCAPAAPENFWPEYDQKRYPAKAIEYLRQTGATKAVFTLDQWGDYLIYKLYPTGRVFVDGRSDFYGTEFDEAYLDVLNVKWGWERTLSRYGVDTILLPVEAPLAGALKESKQWRVMYDDRMAIVFRSAAADRAAERTSIADSGTKRDQEIAKPKLTTKLEHSSTGGERP